MLPENRANMEDEFRRYYGGLVTDEAKVAFLKMLKERVFSQEDKNAAAVLPGLVEKWLREPYR